MEKKWEYVGGIKRLYTLTNGHGHVRYHKDPLAHMLGPRRPFCGGWNPFEVVGPHGERRNRTSTRVAQFPKF